MIKGNDLKVEYFILRINKTLLYILLKKYEYFEKIKPNFVQVYR